MGFADKVCIVTGGSRGIGKAIGLEMAKMGADVVINYQSNRKAAEEVMLEIEKLGKRARIYKADVADGNQVAEMVNNIYKEFGKIDILVNNAGITRDSLILRMKEEDWDGVINTNLKGVYNMSKACAKYMVKQRRGRIINISSIVGLFGNAGQTNYSAAKAGIIGFTRSLAKELGSRGITVNAVAPGFIKTDMTLGLIEKDISIKEKIPLKRVGTPEDIAQSVVFLASDKASYITGQVLAIDGGLGL